LFTTAKKGTELAPNPRYSGGS